MIGKKKVLYIYCALFAWVVVVRSISLKAGKKNWFFFVACETTSNNIFKNQKKKLYSTSKINNLDLEKNLESNWLNGLNLVPPINADDIEWLKFIIFMQNLDYLRRWCRLNWMINIFQILFVVENFLVTATWSVLYIVQWSNFALGLDINLLIYNLEKKKLTKRENNNERHIHWD